MQYSRQVAYVNCIIVNASQLSDCDCNKLLTDNNSREDQSHTSHSTHAHIKISAPEEFYVMSVIPTLSHVFTDVVKQSLSFMSVELSPGLKDKPFQPPRLG